MTASTALLKEMARAADPLADQVVAAIMGQWTDPATAPSAGLARLASATRLMAQWRSNAALADWHSEDPNSDPALVQLLRNYLAEGSRLPSWVDAAKVARAEAVFMQEGPMSCTLLFCASLPECYVLPNLSDVLHVAGQLEAHTEHRIRQTAAMVFPVMLKGGLLSSEGCGVAQVLKVRLIHATIRHLILHGPPEEASGTVLGIPEASAAPEGHAAVHRAMNDALLGLGWDVPERGLPCNQLELAYTLLTFSYVFLRGMRRLHLALPPADEAAFLHTWNVAGYVLGVRDDLMASSYDEAAELFERLREAGCAGFSEQLPSRPDTRPSLGRALVGAMAHTIRLPVIRSIPVPLTQWLMGRDASKAIGLGQAASTPTRLLFFIGLGLLRLIDGVARLVLPQFSISRSLTRVLGYHLLSRFLLDQTRPLGLPEQVLMPLQGAVADWHHEPRAPAWLNRLEDALTTRGRWLPGRRGGHNSTLPKS